MIINKQEVLFCKIVRKLCADSLINTNPTLLFASFCFSFRFYILQLITNIIIGANQSENKRRRRRMDWCVPEDEYCIFDSFGNNNKINGKETMPFKIFLYGYLTCLFIGHMHQHVDWLIIACKKKARLSHSRSNYIKRIKPKHTMIENAASPILLI